MIKPATIFIVGALALALAACGDDDGPSAEAEATATPDEAIEQIADVRTGLASALEDYAAGEAETAAETVNETYLQHFELVEGPLEEADHELNEELEEQIREELVDEIESGAPKAEVAGLVAEIDKGLDDAEAALGAGEPAAQGKSY